VKTHRVVILGGGFAGLNVALLLEKCCGAFSESPIEIILVDRHPEHLYTPLLYEVASGFLETPSRVCRGGLRQGLCVGFEEFRTIIGSKMIHFHAGDVEGVDPARNVVHLKGQEDLTYDDLVIALGSETNFFGINGLQTHAFALKSLREAFAIRSALHDFLDRYREGKEEKLQVVVGGAGASGTEFAAEVANFFQRLQREGVLQSQSWSVQLVEMGPEILSMCAREVARAASNRLANLGVEVLRSTRIEEVTERSIRLLNSAGIQELEADVVVWCGGIKPSQVLKQCGVPLGPKGHVMIDDTFLVQGLSNVFALGDAAQFQDPHTKEFVPSLAQAAIAQAEIVAQNIAQHLENKPLMRWHPPHYWPFILPLGGVYAIATIGRFTLRGPLAYLLRKGADLRYLLRILPFFYAMKVWFEGAKTYLKND